MTLSYLTYPPSIPVYPSTCSSLPEITAGIPLFSDPISTRRYASQWQILSSSLLSYASAQDSAGTE